MIASFVSLSHVVAIAHRGGSALRPENTITSFDHGLALGADGLECDVHLSRDGEVIVIHDPTLERTTSGTGAVADRTAAELSRLDAGFQFGAAQGFPFRGQGIGVPRLRDLLDRYKTPIVIEMKGEDIALVPPTIEVVRKAHAADRVILAGFSGPVVAESRRLAPDIMTSAAFNEAAVIMQDVAGGHQIDEAAVDYKLFQVPFRFHGQQRFAAPFINAARGAGLPVQAWIVDDPEDMRQIIEWGVTGIISDRPDLAVEAARHANARRA